jgi:TolB-like protein/Flp pilus assembly protein TadD
LTDVFAIQSDLAQKITNELRVKLSPKEKARIEHKPTENGEAYLAFVLAHNLSDPVGNLEKLRESEHLYARAIELDPDFALAIARYSQLISWIFHTFDATPARREQARNLAERALQLQPELPETHLARGCSYYYGDNNYDAALREFQIAQHGLPNESETCLYIGAIQRRQGKWAESTTNLEKAAALDPKNAMTLLNLAMNSMYLRKFVAADQTLDRAIAEAPESFAILWNKAYLTFAWRGDLTQAEKEISSIPAGADSDGPNTWSRWYFLMVQRKFPQALTVVEGFPNESLITNSPGPGIAPKAWLQGIIHLLQGDKSRSQVELERARVVSEKLLREAPEDPGRHAQHGLILSALGRKEEAIAEGKRSVELLPESQDAVEGPQYTVSLAQIYAWAGESDEAFRLIDHLLVVPNGLTVPMLKLDPAWDPLRSDPRFQELCRDKLDKSIAVLPFENLSKDEENAFFAGGVQDEILTDLAKIADLKVISRTSVTPYKSGVARNLRQIGQQLGVAHVVEGSVQRAANRVRVNAQLVDARTDRHLWAQTYDRDLADVFAVESEVAKAIADQLRAKLTGHEEQVIAAKPTDNPEAYEAYLRGRAFAGESPFDKSNVERTIQSYQEAVKLDPSFALAWAYLSCAQSGSYWLGQDPSPAQLAAAKDAADRALALDAGSSE